ncbi:Uncharacterized protein FKW44_023895 [Caligus rogercresseyi]|uniref:Uncharacterized protein n=1 Tax=Caligus rogercresseyi TaxID=217165 RepID=A0A7T8JVP9_CALRO|nr:Uncharacterized protein FKW44_023895 [Caligus rogercresseyi]
MTLYWATTNVISVAQVKLIRQPRVRKLCGIPDFVEWSKKKDKFNSKDKGFKDSVKDAMDNWKVQRDVMDRRALTSKSSGGWE